MRAITEVNKEKSTMSTYLVVETADKKASCLFVLVVTRLVLLLWIFQKSS